MHPGAGLESQEQNATALIDSLRKYARIEVPDRGAVVELIDSITVSEQHVPDGTSRQVKSHKGASSCANCSSRKATIKKSN
jgi:hypothetical protein